MIDRDDMPRANLFLATLVSLAATSGYAERGRRPGTAEASNAQSRAPASLTLASREGELLSLALDESSIYWTNREGALRKAPKGGGTLQTLAEFEMPPTLVGVDAVAAYVVTADTLFVVRRTGGKAKALFSTEERLSFCALDDSDVYCVVGNRRVLRIPKKGGVATVVVARASGEDVTSIAVDRSALYVAVFTEAAVYQAADPSKRRSPKGKKPELPNAIIKISKTDGAVSR
ncbi:MAG: hypothetical protein ACOZIN_11055, partial [Myxococcota bacterium]